MASPVKTFKKTNGESKTLMDKYKCLVDLMPGHWATVGPVLNGVVLLQPEAARIILERYSPTEQDGGIVNRKMSPHNKNRIMASQREGAFVFTGVPVIFDKRPRLIDGNHRLNSCVETSIPMPLAVTIGADTEVFDVLDQNLSRRMRDVLWMKGVQDIHGPLSHAVKVLCAFLNNSGDLSRCPRVSHSNNRQLETLLEEHPGLEASVRFIWELKTLRSIAKMPGLIICLHYVFNRIRPDLASAFFSTVNDTAGEIPDSEDGLFLQPAKALRARLLDNRIHKERLTVKELAVLAVRAWNACFTGETVRKLNKTCLGKFPEIAGLEYEDDGRPVI